MTMFDFLLLPENEQLDILYSEGVYLSKRIAETIPVVLYQIEDFYVEVFYKEYRRYIQRIRCFKSTSLLDPYLEQIQLTQWVF